MNYRCPVCETLNEHPELFDISTSKDFSFPGFTYSRCSSCRSIFLSNTVDDVYLANAHRDYWGVGPTFEFKYAPERSVRDRRTDWIRFYSSIFHESFMAGLPRNPTLLDIGCGTGEFCSAATHFGFHCFGIDPSEHSILVALAEFPECSFFNMPFTSDCFSEKGDSPLEQRAFDVITLHAIIEHVAEPVRLLRHAASRLARHGTLLVKLPNADCLQLNLLKKWSWNFMAPFHRTFFSVDGFTRMLHKLGLEVVRYHKVSDQFGWTRGLVQSLCIGAEYAAMRESEAFRKLDYSIDVLLTNIALDFGKAPVLFAELKHASS